MLRSISIAIRIHSQLIKDKTIGFVYTENMIQYRLCYYIFIFIFSWFFGLLHRFIEYINPNKTNDITSLLAALFIPLQGFLNAICYGGLLDSDSILIRFLKQICFYNYIPNFRIISIPEYIENPILLNGIIGNSSSSVPFKSLTFSIFTSTLNLGECSLEYLGELPNWIPKGYDIYAIGVQECLCLHELQTAIYEHIGGSTEFELYFSEIGSSQTTLGYHGYIAISVFIRKKDILSGNIRVIETNSKGLATCANLIITHAANKGAVGLPFRIHDITIVFLTAHLESDSNGISKLHRRNESAQCILSELCLSTENIGCDLHNQHDHVIFMGDLNYRVPCNIDGTGIYTTLTTVAQATAVEMNIADERNSTRWMKNKYELLNNFPSSYARSMSSDDYNLILNAKKESKLLWDGILSNDELTQMMNLGEVFFSFVEPPPRFPPSYKRIKGQEEGICRDYTNLAMLQKAYDTGANKMNQKNINRLQNVSQPIPLPTQAMDEQQHNDIAIPTNSSNNILIKSSKSKLRPPSYTDRILYHSLKDKEGKLTSIAYETCDDIRGSDHRPVSMSFNLEVINHCIYVYI
jgi:hypothetical protein